MLLNSGRDQKNNLSDLKIGMSCLEIQSKYKGQMVKIELRVFVYIAAQITPSYSKQE